MVVSRPVCIGSIIVVLSALIGLVLIENLVSLNYHRLEGLLEHLGLELRHVVADVAELLAWVVGVLLWVHVTGIYNHTGLVRNPTGLYVLILPTCRVCR